jgi:hypothetical protein
MTLKRASLGVFDTPERAYIAYIFAAWQARTLIKHGTSRDAKWGLAPSLL